MSARQANISLPPLAALSYRQFAPRIAVREAFLAASVTILSAVGGDRNTRKMKSTYSVTMLESEIRKLEKILPGLKSEQENVDMVSSKPISRIKDKVLKNEQPSEAKYCDQIFHI